MEQRFPEDAQVTLKALNIILNPKALTNNNAEVALFGQNELDYLLQRYGQENQNIVNSASCERGFSAQNKIKSKSRNRLRDEQVDRLMKITINGPHYAEYDYTAAKNNFRAMKDRIQ